MKTLLAITLSAAIALSGCATTSNGYVIKHKELHRQSTTANQALYFVTVPFDLITFPIHIVYLAFGMCNLDNDKGDL